MLKTYFDPSECVAMGKVDVDLHTVSSAFDMSVVG